MLDTSRLPSYAFLSPQAIEQREEDTRKGAYALLPFEKTWRDRQPGLLQRGYVLRQRYHPDWKPSWEGTNVEPDFCEDSVAQLVSQVNRFGDSSQNTISIAHGRTRRYPSGWYGCCH